MGFKNSVDVSKSSGLNHGTDVASIVSPGEQSSEALQLGRGRLEGLRTPIVPRPVWLSWQKEDPAGRSAYLARKRHLAA